MIPGICLIGINDCGELVLRIAHLTTVDMSLALLLATELDEDMRSGHEVFGISAPGPYVDRVEALGVTHVPVNSLTRSWNLGSDIRAFFELARTIKSLKLDVLHTHTPKAGVMGRIAGRLARVPVVVNTCHGLWAHPDDPFLKRAFVYGAEALAIRFSDYELFQNEQDAQTLRRFLKRNRWQVVGNGIDLERFQPDLEGRARIRADWGVSDDQLVVGTVGRRVREKGLAEFAETAHRLRHRAVFVWIGPEDDTDQETTVLHQDAIRFVGEYEDMTAVYSALDVFALASYREGFSRASMEAAACGLPMVLSDIRGCREIGTHGEHLLLVDSQNGRALSDAVDQLLQDVSLRTKLSAAAQRRALSQFDQRHIARTSLETYAACAPAFSRTSQPSSRILHLLPEDRDRGAQVFAGRLRDHLNSTSTQEHLIATLFESPEAAMKAEIRLGVKSSLLRRAGLSPRAAMALRRTIKNLNPDVVVAHGGEALKYLVAAGGAKTTVYKRTGLSNAEVSRPLHRRLYKFLAHRVTHTVGVAKSLLDQSQELFGLDPDKCSLIPNSRDPEIYYPQDAENGLTPCGPVLFIGQLENGKRPEMFVETIALLRERGVEVTACMIGDGPLREAIAPQAQRAGVELLGPRTDVPERLRNASVLVMTSVPGSEGMPGVLIEAGMSGIPVVSTNASGVSDVVFPGKTGFIAGTDSAEELTDLVQQLLLDPNLRIRMGTAARKRCVELFSFDSTAVQWLQLLNSLAAGAPSSNGGPVVQKGQQSEQH